MAAGAHRTQDSYRTRTPTGAASFGAYGMAVEIVAGQWTYQRAGGNPGVGANWTVFPETERVGVILVNRDGVDLVDMLARETEAITGVAPDYGSGG